MDADHKRCRRALSPRQQNLKHLNARFRDDKRQVKSLTHRSTIQLNVSQKQPAIAQLQLKVWLSSRGKEVLQLVLHQPIDESLQHAPRRSR